MALSQTDQFVKAAGEGRLLQMMKFLRSNTDMDLQDSKGDTALCKASAGGYHEICRKLVIGHRANPNARDSQGKTPIHYAAAGGHERLVELFVHNEADVQVVDNDGWSPLHHAAESGNWNSLRLLLRKGTPLNVQTPTGSTAAHVVLHSNNFSLDVLEELCGWPGARPDMKNNAEENVLDVARRLGNRPAIDYLVKIGRKSFVYFRTLFGHCFLTHVLHVL